jgi:hypothetical protein
MDAGGNIKLRISYIKRGHFQVANHTCPLVNKTIVAVDSIIHIRLNINNIR